MSNTNIKKMIPTSHGSSGPLTLMRILDDLRVDERLSDGEVQRILLQQKKSGRGLDLHPFVIISSYQIKDLRPPHQPWTVELLTLWMAQRSKLPYLKIDPLEINVEEVTRLVAEPYVRRIEALPVKVTDKEMVFAMGNPYNRGWIEELERVVRRKIILVVANPLQVQQYITEFYSVSKSINRIIPKQTGESCQQETDFYELESFVSAGRQQELKAEDAPVVKIVDWLVQYALDERASDVHLEPKIGDGQIRFRIDGVMRVIHRLPMEVLTPVLSRLKVLSNMKVEEKRRPQDGSYKKKVKGDKEIELRLSTIPTPAGEKMVMRLFDPEVSKMDFEQLGFLKDDLKIWEQLINSSHGLILVTGPTGSGKTTTLYSTLKKLATSEINLCTIEDPIEMVEERFSQMQIHPKIGVNFADGIRAFLRQDPDIIMVGEIRDGETGEMATQAALTGHLVFSTLHTNDAISSVTRLLDLGVPSYLLNASLLGILSQRLVRILCPHCKKKISTPPDLWKALLKEQEQDYPRPEFIYGPQGCSECKETGYLGRTCIYELLPMHEQLKKHIRPNVELSTLQRVAGELVRPIHVNGALKIMAGVTSLAEVLNVVL